MRVVLRTDLPQLGKRGDICDVADGYARNFLLPKGHAIKATAGVTAQANSMRRARDLRDARDREAAETVARTLVPVVIRIKAKAGAGDKLFGSVTAADVVAAIKKAGGPNLDKRIVRMPKEHIKSLGTHTATAHLHPDINVELTL
ncbi:MAG TPA: 50S ribosomal protein L9, partial [Acidimicrobiales bacterium]|nr:50S ribosomal protein L9 [Acidimicrobiales bacterium]